MGKAIESSYLFLKNSISSGTWNSIPHLPSLESLARQAGVSRSTMWKALSRAKQEGLVASERGGFINLASQSRKKPPYDGAEKMVKDRHDRFIDKKDMLERDILDGAYAEQEALPGAKQLQATYGASAATMRKILQSLTSDRLIAPYKKSFKVTGLIKHRRGGTRVVLVSEGIYTAKSGVHNQRLQAMINTMEHLGAHAGIKTDFIDLDMLEPNVSMTMGASIGDRETIAGFIFNIPATPSSAARNRVIELTKMLAQYKRPLAIFDATGEFMPPSGSDNKRTQLFRMAAMSAGRAVGRYLIGLGHRDAAYITLLHRHEWSMQRLTGLTRAFRMMGMRSRVTPHVIDTIEGHFDRAFWLGNLDRPVIEKVLAHTMPFERTGYLAELGRTSGMQFPVDDPRIKQIQASVAILGELYERKLDPDIFAAMREAVMDEAAFKGNDYLLEPLFEKAVADKEITAWICGNSGEAHAALRFLKSKNIRVPQEVSVIGFDNIATSFENRLTTYDFNMEKAMYRMFRFAVQTSPRLNKTALPVMELEGMIIERETAGRAQIKKRE